MAPSTLRPRAAALGRLLLLFFSLVAFPYPLLERHPGSPLAAATAVRLRLRRLMRKKSAPGRGAAVSTSPDEAEEGPAAAAPPSPRPPPRGPRERARRLLAEAAANGDPEAARFHAAMVAADGGAGAGAVGRSGGEWILERVSAELGETADIPRQEASPQEAAAPRGRAQMLYRVQTAIERAQVLAALGRADRALARAERARRAMETEPPRLGDDANRLADVMERVGRQVRLLRACSCGTLGWFRGRFLLPNWAGSHTAICPLAGKWSSLGPGSSTIFPGPRFCVVMMFARLWV